MAGLLRPAVWRLAAFVLVAVNLNCYGKFESVTEKFERMTEEDITEMSDWLKKRKISEDVVKTLVKKGYTSMEALAMLTGEDISDINAGLTKTQKFSRDSTNFN